MVDADGGAPGRRGRWPGHPCGRTAEKYSSASTACRAQVGMAAVLDSRFVREIASLHDAQVEVASGDAGRGVRFSVTSAQRPSRP